MLYDGVKIVIYLLDNSNYSEQLDGLRKSTRKKIHFFSIFLLTILECEGSNVKIALEAF